MISVVVVYNNERALNEILLKSIKNQTAKFELIPVDNTKGEFKSAAEALNWGGKQANGKYIMFVHQDVDLGSDSWLEDVERILDTIPNCGIAGVAGMNEKGKNNTERGRGYVVSSGKVWDWSNAVQKPEEVQTLDELLLIVPKSVFNKLKFDKKTFDGWHCYGADYCLCVRQMGLKVYVVPMFVYHRAIGSNPAGLLLLKYQKRLYNKHKKVYKHIYTTMGEISLIKLKLSLYFKIFMSIYKKLFPSWTEYLKRELSNHETVLDLGCGHSSPIRYCNVPFSVGVELFEPYLKETKKVGIHNQYIKADIRKIEFKPKSFDVILCLGVLEHLTKEEGYELIKKMERWARKKIIITTPNGLWQNNYGNNPLQEHKSGWSVEELKKLGFKIYGMEGWKKLRGNKGTYLLGHPCSIKYRPSLFWVIISNITQKITYYCPKSAFQLFAVKQIGDVRK